MTSDYIVWHVVVLFIKLRDEIKDAGEWKVKTKRRMKYLDKSSVSYDCPILFAVFRAGEVLFSVSRFYADANSEEFAYL